MCKTLDMNMTKQRKEEEKEEIECLRLKNRIIDDAAFN